MTDDPGEKVNIEEAVSKFLEKFQKPEDGALKLYGENYQLRQTNRTLTTENDELKKRVPADGSVVISKDDHAILEAVKTSGLKIEEIASLKDENGNLKRDKVLREVADSGYSYEALRDFDTLEGGLEYVVKEETKDGKVSRSVVVKVDGKERPLDEYATEKRPALAQILKSESAQGGTPYVNQTAGGKAPSTNRFDRIRDEEKAKQTKKEESKPLEERLGIRAA